MQEETEEGVAQAAIFLVRLVYVALLGLLGILVFSAQSQHWKNSEVALVFSVGFMAAGAAWLAGGLFGFLFGIPYSARQAVGRPQGESSQPNESPRETKGDSDYRSNTNLEQISDWLTKILVGVGLTQIGQIPHKLDQIASYVAGGMPECTSAKPFVVTTIVYFAVCGFLFGFLWARLYLPREYYLADIFAIGKRLDRLQKQQELGVKALTLTQQLLDPSPGDPPPSPDTVKSAIKVAPKTIKPQIFELAKKARTRGGAQAVIPIFEALTESDTNDIYHQNHSQLAYASAEQSPPDWKRAEEELTKAIAIRNKLNKKGWSSYELKRALYKIKQDSNFLQGTTADPQTRASILDDLRVVAKSDHKDDMKDTPEIDNWLTLNNAKQEVG